MDPSLHINLYTIYMQLVKQTVYHASCLSPGPLLLSLLFVLHFLCAGVCGYPAVFLQSNAMAV